MRCAVVTDVGVVVEAVIIRRFTGTVEDQDEGMATEDLQMRKAQRDRKSRVVSRTSGIPQPQQRTSADEDAHTELMMLRGEPRRQSEARAAGAGPTHVFDRADTRSNDNGGKDNRELTAGRQYSISPTRPSLPFGPDLTGHGHHGSRTYNETLKSNTFVSSPNSIPRLSWADRASLANAAPQNREDEDDSSHPKKPSYKPDIPEPSLFPDAFYTKVQLAAAHGKHASFSKLASERAIVDEVAEYSMGNRTTANPAPQGSAQESALCLWRALVEENVRYCVRLSTSPESEVIVDQMDILPFGFNGPSTVFTVRGQHTNRGIVMDMAPDGRLIIQPYATDNGAPMLVAAEMANRITGADVEEAWRLLDTCTTTQHLMETSTPNTSSHTPMGFMRHASFVDHKERGSNASLRQLHALPPKTTAGYLYKNGGAPSAVGNNAMLANGAQQAPGAPATAGGVEWGQSLLPGAAQRARLEAANVERTALLDVSNSQESREWYGSRGSGVFTPQEQRTLSRQNSAYMGDPNQYRNSTQRNAQRSQYQSQQRAGPSSRMYGDNEPIERFGSLTGFESQQQNQQQQQQQQQRQRLLPKRDLSPAALEAHRQEQSQRSKSQKQSQTNKYPRSGSIIAGERDVGGRWTTGVSWEDNSSRGPPTSAGRYRGPDGRRDVSPTKQMPQQTTLSTNRSRGNGMKVPLDTIGASHSPDTQYDSSAYMPTSSPGTQQYEKWNIRDVQLAPMLSNAKPLPPVEIVHTREGDGSYAAAMSITGIGRGFSGSISSPQLHLDNDGRGFLVAANGLAGSIADGSSCVLSTLLTTKTTAAMKGLSDWKPSFPHGPSMPAYVPPLKVGSVVLARRFGNAAHLEVGVVVSAFYDCTYNIRYVSDRALNERVLHNDVFLVDERRAEDCTARDRVVVVLHKQFPAVIVEAMGSNLFRVMLYNSSTFEARVASIDRFRGLHAMEEENADSLVVTRRNIVFIVPSLRAALYAPRDLVQQFRRMDHNGEGLVSWSDVRHWILSWENYGCSITFEQLGGIQRDLCIQTRKLDPHLMRRVPIQDDTMQLDFPKFEFVVRRARNRM